MIENTKIKGKLVYERDLVCKISLLNDIIDIVKLQLERK